MGLISLKQAQANYYNGVIEKFTDEAPVETFLDNFFPSERVKGLYVPISVKRAGRPIAVGVLRGTEGQTIKSKRSTEELMLPEMYQIDTNLTLLDNYRRVFLDPDIKSGDVSALAGETANELMIIKDMIMRAKNRQISDTLNTGIVRMNNLTDIDYERKSYSGTLAAITDTTPLGIYSVQAADRITASNDNLFKIIRACTNWMHLEGKTGANGTIKGIFGEDVKEIIINNDEVAKRLNFRHATLASLERPAKTTSGGTFHGLITIGSYNIELWTFVGGYDDPTTGEHTRYLSSKDIHLFGEGFRGKVGFADAPEIAGGNALMKTMAGSSIGAGLLSRLSDREMGIIPYVDIQSRTAAHWFGMRACPLAVPVSIDRFSTIKDAVD